MYAARQGALDAVRALAECGADLNAADPDGTPALTFAIINGHYDVATLLVEKGADVEPARSDRRDAALFRRRHAHAADVVRPSGTAASDDRRQRRHGEDAAGSRRGPEPNAQDESAEADATRPATGGSRDGATPLMRAARSSDVVMMRLLIDSGAELDRQNAAGETALHIAMNSPKAVRFLTDEGAAPDVKNARGLTPLEALLKAQNPNAESIALLRDLTGDYTTQPSPEAPAGRRR